jgi:nucleoside-diphosphate-sugar epimerase
MKILVTGATGYIGSKVLECATANGATAEALVRRPMPWTVPHRVYVSDLSAKSIAAILKTVRPDAIFHLAAHTSAGCGPADADTLVEANLVFGARLLAAFFELGGGIFLNAGSYWEYDEQGRYAPNTLYAATKRAFHDLLVYYSSRENITAATLVLFDVYGPGDRRAKLVPQMISSVKQGASLKATGGEQVLNLVHVNDVAEGFFKTAAALPVPGKQRDCPVYALDGDQPCTVRELAAHISRLAGRELKMSWGAREYGKSQIFRPVTGLPRPPGWRPQVSLENGLRRLLEESVPDQKEAR